MAKKKTAKKTAEKAVKTSSNGRPYVINSDGRAEFISAAAAKKAGWSKKAAKKPAGKRA